MLSSEGKEASTKLQVVVKTQHVSRVDVYADRNQVLFATSPHVSFGPEFVFVEGHSYDLNRLVKHRVKQGVLSLYFDIIDSRSGQNQANSPVE